MPIRACHEGRPLDWLARWRILSIGPDSAIAKGALWKDTPSCNRASPLRSLLTIRVHSRKEFFPARAASIHIRRPFLMCTRICSKKVPTPGKGIYDIDAFEAALAGKVPENALLSHDLFEGIFARVALATDIELFEEFPSRYEAIAARQDRWARGDWQLLPWLFGRGQSGRRNRSPFRIPIIGRWKILDNLRRTLSAPAAFLTLIVGWLLPPASPWVWTGFILGTIAIPALLPFLIGLSPRRKGISLRSHFRGVLSDLGLGVSQIGLSFIFLAYQAWLMTDAILRTLARLFITHRNLLEWVTAAQSKFSAESKLSGIYQRMAGGVAVAAVAVDCSSGLWATSGLDCGGAIHCPLGCGPCRRSLDQSSTAFRQSKSIVASWTRRLSV